MSNAKSYYLDPDFRKKPNTTKPFCVRCQKPLTGNTKLVTVDWETMQVTEGGQIEIGADCWKKITKARKAL